MTNPIKKATIYGIISILLALIIASSAFADSGFCTSGEVGNISIHEVMLNSYLNQYGDQYVTEDLLPDNSPFAYSMNSEETLAVTVISLNSGDHPEDIVAQAVIYSNSTGQLISFSQTPVLVSDSLTQTSYTLILGIPLTQDILKNTDYKLYVDVYSYENKDLECAEYEAKLAIESYMSARRMADIYTYSNIIHPGQEITLGVEIGNPFQFILNNISVSISDPELGIEQEFFIDELQSRTGEAHDFTIIVPENIHNKTLLIHPEISLSGVHITNGHSAYLTITDLNINDFLIMNNVGNLVFDNNPLMIYWNIDEDMVESGVDKEFLQWYSEGEGQKSVKMSVFEFMNQTAAEIYFNSRASNYYAIPEIYNSSNITIASQSVIAFDSEIESRDVYWRSGSFVIRIHGQGLGAADQIAEAYLALYPSDFTTAQQPVGNSAPSFTSIPVTSVMANTTYHYYSNATDAENDTISFSLSSAPQNMTINDTTGEISWNPQTAGQYPVIIMVSDGELNSTQQFTISVLLPAEQSRFKISAVEATVDNDNQDVEPGDVISDVKPDSDLSFDVTVENAFEDIDMTDVKVDVTIKKIDDGHSLKEKSDLSDLDADSDDQVSLDFKIPLIVDEDNYEVVVYAEGEGDDGVTYSDEWIFNIAVEKENHKVLITKAELDQSSLSCSRTTSLSVKLADAGSKNEDVTLKIINSALGLSLTTPVKLDKDADDEDNTFSEVYSINAENAAAGTYTITVSAAYSGKEERNNVILEVKDCSLPSEDSNSDDSADPGSYSDAGGQAAYQDGRIVADGVVVYSSGTVGNNNAAYAQPSAKSAQNISLLDSDYALPVMLALVALLSIAVIFTMLSLVRK